jgi:thiol-disulfide isomerase/thioredoxin
MKKIFVIILLLNAFIGLKAQCPLTQAEDFTATDVEGHEWNLFEILDDGKYVCIDFFYTTCGPCQQTAPKVNEAYLNFGCNGGDIVFLAIDDGDTDQQCIDFDETFGVEYPTISGIEGGGSAINSTYGIAAFPTIILIAPDRQVVEQDIWPISTGAYLTGVIEAYGITQMECGVGINEEKETNTISNLYPNPANQSLTIEMNLSNKNIHFEIFNLLGVKVKGIKSQAGVQQIDVSDLSAGNYFIRAIEDQKTIDIKQLSVSH